MHQILMTILMLLFGALLLGKGANPVKTVPKVDLQRYLGTWYQLAYFPTSFQPKDCGLTVAKYSWNAKKKRVIVENTCYEDAAGTKIKKRATATAKVVDPSNAKLKVTFFWPFSGDYWIVKLDEKDYSYAAVSDRKRKYLWILTRDVAFDRARYEEITSWLKQNGWDTSKLVVTGILK